MNNIKPVCVLSIGQSFGEYEFFTASPRIYSIRCKNFCSLLKINRNEFLQILKEFPEDHEKFCSIKDSLFIYSD